MDIPIRAATATGESGRPPQNYSIQRLAAILCGRIRNRVGEKAFGFDGRLIDYRHGLVPLVDSDWLEDQPALRERLRQPESGLCLAINSFAPWRREPGKLELLERNGFREVLLHLRCPTGVRGTPPHLEVLVRGERHLVAIHACGPDSLGRPPGRVARAYLDLEAPSGIEPWIELLRDLGARRLRFRMANAPLLGKLALALGRTFPEYEIDLLQLYLEPRDADQYEPFRDLRNELAEIERRVAGARVGFRFDSFGNLWRRWEQASDPDWLPKLASQLRSRYQVAISPRSLLPAATLGRR